MGTGTNQVSTTTNQPFSAFPTNYTNLPTVSFVVPNLTNGMHDGSGNTAIAAGDNWYNTYMAPYVQWARTHNSLFILTFDEDDNLHNQIPTIFSGQMVVQGQYATSMNHYNLLRTIEDMYGLTPHPGAAATSTWFMDAGITDSEPSCHKVMKMRYHFRFIPIRWKEMLLWWLTSKKKCEWEIKLWASPEVWFIQMTGITTSRQTWNQSATLIYKSSKRNVLPWNEWMANDLHGDL